MLLLSLNPYRKTLVYLNWVPCSTKDSLNTNAQLDPVSSTVIAIIMQLDSQCCVNNSHINDIHYSLFSNIIEQNYRYPCTNETMLDILPINNIYLTALTSKI